MVRIAIFLLVLILVLVALYFPRFRGILVGTLVVLMGVIGVIIWQDSRERVLEFERISAEEAQLIDMHARPGLNARSFVVAGRIHNISKDYTILSIQLQVTAKDCELGVCEVVGQEDVTFPLEVPSAQSRDFSVTIPFSVIPEVKGEAAWEYQVLQIRAR